MHRARTPLVLSAPLQAAVFSGAKLPARRSTPGKSLLDVFLLLCRRKILPAGRLL
jgi:hypothetical protein